MAKDTTAANTIPATTTDRFIDPDQDRNPDVHRS
jgi:hypothetical protein